MHKIVFGKLTAAIGVGRCISVIVSDKIREVRKES